MCMQKHIDNILKDHIEKWLISGMIQLSLTAILPSYLKLTLDPGDASDLR